MESQKFQQKVEMSVVTYCQHPQKDQLLAVMPELTDSHCYQIFHQRPE
jgi:hypothetical protein